MQDKTVNKRETKSNKRYFSYDKRPHTDVKIIPITAINSTNIFLTSLFNSYIIRYILFAPLDI